MEQEEVEYELVLDVPVYGVLSAEFKCKPCDVRFEALNIARLWAGSVVSYKPLNSEDKV